MKSVDEINDLKNIISELKNELEQKDKFISTLTHEIRTPLNVIIGLLNELSKKKNTSFVNSHIQEALVASGHLLDVIGNALNISKINNSVLILNERPFNLENLLISLKKFFAIQAKEKYVSLDYHIPQECSVLFIGDDSLLRQVLINIIGNSLKFTDFGHIDVRVAVLEEDNKFDHVYFEIQDTGIGIESEFLNRIFESYTRENSAKIDIIEGTGLGLNISRKIISLMHGDIQIESQKGVGTTVNFHVQLKKAGESDFSLKKTKEMNLNLRDKKILVVEDNELIRILTRNVLTNYQAEICEVENGVDALRKLENYNFDLILMDIQMPFIDGIETTRFIREVLDIEIPVIALTANASQNDLDRCLSAGMNDFILKPFKDEFLIEKISSIISSNIKFISPEILYKLDFLTSTPNGDQDFIKKMLDIFISNVRESLAVFENPDKNENIALVSITAHKLLPSTENLQINLLTEKLKWLDKHARVKNAEYFNVLYLVCLVLKKLIRRFCLS